MKLTKPTITKAQADAVILDVLGQQITQAMIDGRINIGARVQAACLECFMAKRTDTHAEVLRQTLIQLNANLGWKP